MRFIKRHKWLTAAAAIFLFPVLFFGGVVVITGMQCCQDGGGAEITAAADQRPSENEIARAASPDLITLHSVPLRCPLVKGLGCGSESKAIMTRLDASSEVAGTWLDHAGTRLAVLWKEQTGVNARAATVALAFHGDAAAKMLVGNERDAALRDFLMGKGWYRTTALDQLSGAVADLVASRWVTKITAIVPLPQKMRDSLHCALSDRMRRRFVEN